MSKLNVDLDQDRPRPPAGPRSDLSRRILTLLIVVAVSLGGLYAVKVWSEPKEQPAAPVVPAPLPAPEPEPEPAPPEVIALPVAVENPQPDPQPQPDPVPAPEPEPVVAPAPAAAEPEEIDEDRLYSGKDGAVPAADAELQRLYVAAGTALSERDYVKARDLARQALQRPDGAEGNPLWRPVADILGQANSAIALTAVRDPKHKIDHKIVSGDALDKLAAKHGTTREAIQLSNNMKLEDTNIKLGFTLRILPAKWSITVDQNKHLLYLNNGAELFKVYDIGVGRNAKTPPGEFKIASRIKNPAWYPGDGREVPYGDPANVLGTRWMTLEATGKTPTVSGIGIHGTWDEKTVGGDSSNGCIRLRNNDAEELFNLVPLHTPVTIKN